MVMLYCNVKPVIQCVQLWIATLFIALQRGIESCTILAAFN